MRPIELQHAVVLSLFAGRPLAALAAAEGIDPRAFRADGYRNARLAQAVLERLPAFASAFLGRPAAWAYALGFGTSPEFSELVCGGRDLGEAGVAYMVRCPVVDAGLAEVLRLEGALCAPLRTTVADDERSRTKFVLGRRAHVVTGSPALAGWYAVRMAGLMAAGGTTVWERVLDVSKSGGGRGPAVTGETRRYLVLRTSGPRGGTVEDLEGPMAALLELLGTPRSAEEICAAFAEDLSTEDAAELLDSLVADGVLDSVAGEAC